MTNLSVEPLPGATSRPVTTLLLTEGPEGNTNTETNTQPRGDPLRPHDTMDGTNHDRAIATGSTFFVQ
jgi:hypothetical protein